MPFLNEFSTLGRPASGRRTFIYYCYCYYSIDGRVLSKSQSLHTDSEAIFHQVVNYRRAARSLQPRRLPRVDCGRRPLLRVVPLHQLRVKRRPRQPQRLRSADFTL
jgi:hypothetical protein